jgi:hypothetical protein
LPGVLPELLLDYGGLEYKAMAFVGLWIVGSLDSIEIAFGSEFVFWDTFSLRRRPVINPVDVCQESVHCNMERVQTI